MSAPRAAPSLAFQLLPDPLAVARLAATAALPDWARGAGLWSATRTAAELSVVCLEAAVPADVRAERGWRCLAVRGPLAFDATGVLASIAAPLAAAGISLFAISTFDTDYVLVKAEALEAACRALQAAGHRID